MTETYVHSGDLGDIVAALPVLKARPGEELVLAPHACTGYRMTQKRFESIGPLIEAQPYIGKVRWHHERPPGHELDGGVRHRYRNGWNLCDMQCGYHGVPNPHREEPWLYVKSKRVAPIVMHRSRRYMNWNFPWKYLWEKYGTQAIFIGSPDEHREFSYQVGPIAYYPTENLLELARVIQGADLYIGNQSSPFWVAEGLKQNIILEATHPHNCHFQRGGLRYITNNHVDLDGDIADAWCENIVRGHRDYTVISEDRLKVIAKCVRKTMHLEGDTAELGVYRGGGSLLIKRISPSKHHAFDTFAGLPQNVDSGHTEGEFSCSLEEVKKALFEYTDVEFHVGLFPQSIPPLELKFKFVHVDGDLYESTKAAIEYFWPRMVDGGIMVFDDYDWESCPGVKKAIEEAGLKVTKTCPQQCIITK